MSQIITGVVKNSLAQKAGVAHGEMLLRINNSPVNDILDYLYLSVESVLTLELDGKKGRREVHISNPDFLPLGLEFDTTLMDDMQTCKNKCVFCFIDQLPPGMRESLYIKDDDMRMSFLMGNYITLTNLSASDIDRIRDLKISPINISVHSTNPDIRVKMCNNKFAGSCLDTMKLFAEADIIMNCQIVVCPELNDGEELNRTLKDLLDMFPFVASISVVPVGLTKYRRGLYPLKPVGEKEAAEILSIAEHLAFDMQKKHGTRIVFAADELYIKANRPMPSAEWYEDFPQLENGVGMVALLKEEFLDALSDMSFKKMPRPKAVSLATGLAAKPFLEELVALAKVHFPELKCTVYGIKNDFFGPQIDVAGLITGQDLIAQLSGKDLGAKLLIPSTMLSHEKELFLDNTTLADAKRALNVAIDVVNTDGTALLNALFGIV